jgi:hypothetical protein
MSVGAACFAAWWPALFRCQPYREANQNDRRSAADPVAFSPINVTADPFVAGSQEDPAAVAAGDAARDLARWPDRPGPSPVACG